jgi:hypothetical protein
LAVVCAICSRARDLPDDYTLWPRISHSTLDFYPVTPSGKPTQPAKGYVCASCLRCANSMRIHMKAIIRGVKVTQHAVKRFAERKSGEFMPEEIARTAILKIFAQSKPIRFKNKLHPPDGVQYTYAQGFIFVVAQEDPPVIVTVETTGHRKLNSDFWYEGWEANQGVNS